MSVRLSVRHTPKLQNILSDYFHHSSFSTPNVIAIFRRRPTGRRMQVGYKQELSYRKQIARQLHTQYVEGIYRPKYYTAALKSTLMVTQGHWKRNHWIDHTRLAIDELFDDEYYRDLEM